MRNYTGPRANEITDLCKIIDLVLPPKEARKEKLKLKRADRREMEALDRKWRNTYSQLKKQ